MHFPESPDSRWALAWLLGLLIVLLLLMAGPRAHGQTESESEPKSLAENLTLAEQTLSLLVTRLGERQKQVADLQSNLLTSSEKLRDLGVSLETLRVQLEVAQSSLETSRSDLMATSTSLQSLSRRYDELERNWQAYRDEMKKQMDAVTLERNRARRFVWVFGIGTLTGAIACTIMALCLH